MKWKERILLLIFLFVIVVLAVLRKKSIDESLTYPLVYIEARKNITQVDNNLRRSQTIGEQSKWQPIHAWDMWKDMVRERAITHKSQTFVDMIVKEMVRAKVVSADVGYKGTQLKTLLTLDGPEIQYAVFKPKRYERTKVLGGTPYEGYDRHNAEIAAFHLDRIFEFYRAPPSVGRVIDLKTEIMPNAKKKLLNTFFNVENNVCFYGVCLYCRKEEPACGIGTQMEGSLTLWIPSKWKISKKPHPWRRTYNKRKARWEIDDSYCSSVTKTVPYNKGPRLLDIMDASVFDFIIGNADRHHYEYLSHDTDNGMLLLLDNGKSFGNPNKDEISILAPIYQCCTLRYSTYRKLVSFSPDSKNSSSLSHILATELKKDPISPILTESHLLAIDRRVKIILVTLSTCFDAHGKDVVLKK